MLLKLTIVYAKTNPTTKWFHETMTQSEEDYFQDNFVKNGKLTLSRTVSEDGVFMTAVYHYKNLQAREDHLSDPTISDLRNRKDQWNAEKNIIRVSFDLANV